MPNLRQLLSLKGLALILLLLISCQPRDKASLLYQKTLEAFDPERPGYSLDTAAKDQKLDHPMAYALFASAEAKRYQLTRDRKALDNSLNAIEWLINNKTSKDNGASVGWGLSFAWDAFGDGSINSKETIYLITNIMVVQALLDLYDVYLETKGELESNSRSRIESLNLLETALGAVKTFTGDRYDKDQKKGEAAFWFSTSETDKYHVININSLFSGQLQRLSKHLDAEQAVPLIELADMAFLYVINRAQKDKSGRFFWFYGGEKWIKNSVLRPNDLIHESYVIQGLLDYKKNNGRYSDRISTDVLYESLRRFVDGEQVYEFPEEFRSENVNIFFKNANNTRLWSIGYASYVASELERYTKRKADLSQTILCFGIRNRYSDGQWYYLGDKKDNEFYSRQVSPVLISLAANSISLDKCSVKV